MIADALRGIWEDLLLKAPVDDDEDFFEAGGDSLKVVELEMKLRQAFGCDLSIEQIYGACTIRTLGALVGQSPLGAEPVAADVGPAGCVPLLPGQRSLLEVECLDIGNPLWNILIRLSIKGRLDADRLRAVLADIVHRQPALRTVPWLRDGAVVGMRLLDRVPIFVADVSHSFDFEAGPLFSVGLAHVGPDEHELIFVVHHLIFDAASARIFVSALVDGYAGRGAGAEHRLASAGRFAGVALPAAREPLERAVGRQHQFVIGRALTASLKRAAKTLATGCLAALFDVLLEMKGGDRVMVGTSIDVRRGLGLDGMIGCLLHHAELTCERAALPSLVEQAHLALARSMDGRAGISDRPVWPYAFVFYTEKPGVLQAGGLTVRPLDSYPGYAKRDLTLRVFHDVADGSLACCFDYRANLFGGREIEALARSFEATIEAIVDSYGIRG